MLLAPAVGARRPALGCRSRARASSHRICMERSSSTGFEPGCVGPAIRCRKAHRQPADRLFPPGSNGPVRRPPRVGDPESPAGGATRRRRRRAAPGSPLKRGILGGTFRPIGTRLQATSDAGPGSSPAPRLPFDLPESKPGRRVIRRGITGRSGVLARIEAAGPVPVIAVVAPAGYGMATLLAQCAERKGSRAAWISCGCGRQRRGRGCPNGLLAGSGRGRAEPDEGDRPECPSAAVVLDRLEGSTNRGCHDLLTGFALLSPRTDRGGRRRHPRRAHRGAGFMTTEAVVENCGGGAADE
jgi:hypothetical protein